MILQGDCIEVMEGMDPGIFDCCVTSPPYYQLRDYGHPGQIGLEGSPEQYVERIVAACRSIRRVLRDDGTLWLNLGDSYWGGGSSTAYGNDFANFSHKSTMEGTHFSGSLRPVKPRQHPVLKEKDLIGIPWRVALALQADGWYLRQDIIWHKLNPMPRPETDRFVSSHEYIFLFSKSKRYYFDYKAVQEPAVGKPSGNKARKENHQPKGGSNVATGIPWEGKPMRNRRDVWPQATKRPKAAHFATYPEEIVEPCVLAGSRPGGTVLDPFFGTGTTGAVAGRLGRSFVGIEIQQDFIDMAEKRLNEQLGVGAW